MKSFLEYILEGHFKNKDFIKTDKAGNLKYIIPVLKDIVEKGKIILGTTDHDVKTKTVSNDVKKELSQYLNDNDRLSTLTREIFDDIVKKDNFRWTQIFKDTYSLIGGGQTAKFAEAGTAYCYNALHGKATLKVEAENNNILNATTEILTSKGFDKQWIKSAQLTAQKISDVTKNNHSYIATHVDGHDISEIPENVKIATKVLTGKVGIKEVFGELVTDEAINNLYPGSNKDNWNKADIALIDEKLNILEELNKYLKANSLKQLISSSDINAFINTLIIGNKDDKSSKYKCRGKMMIPISQKGIVITKSTTVNNISFEADGKLTNPQELNEITNVDIILPGTIKAADKNPYTATCYLKTNNNLQINFRNKDPKKETLIIEIQLKGARGGNGIGLLKNRLNLADGFYKNVLEKNNITSEDDYVNAIYDLTGIKLNIPTTLQQAVSGSKNNWFQRPAFKGLLSFLLKYREAVEQKTTSKTDLVNLFRLMYRCASGAFSESIFWLIKTK